MKVSLKLLGKDPMEHSNSCLMKLISRMLKSILTKKYFILILGICHIKKSI